MDIDELSFPLPAAAHLLNLSLHQLNQKIESKEIATVKRGGVLLVLMGEIRRLLPTYAPEKLNRRLGEQPDRPALPPSLAELLEKVDLKAPGAAAEAIADVGHRLRFDFPLDYAEFMQLSNGAEGWVGEGYVALRPIEDLVAWCERYRAVNPELDLVPFGTDGAGEVFAFALSAGSAIVEADAVVMRQDEAVFCGYTFIEFLRTVSANSQWQRRRGEIPAP